MTNRVRKFFQAGHGQQQVKLHISVDVAVFETIASLAEMERTDPASMARSLLEMAVGQREHYLDLARTWQRLTNREQEITALICQRYTNPQIANQLNISVNTVKTHVKNVLEKFDVGSKAALRELLIDWDFSDWAHR